MALITWITVHLYLKFTRSQKQLTMEFAWLQDRAVNVYAHNFSTGGVSNIIFTTDTNRVITTGYDGVMCCYKWKSVQLILRY